MCGIAGFQGNHTPELLARMSARIAHRGPDGSGAVLLNHGSLRTGLAHRRLAIIDLSSAADQPMTVDCSCCGASSLKQLALIFNGEIYNFRELRGTLQAKGHTFATASDSEVLLHAYTEYGRDFVKHLNGIFALAIYDARDRGRPAGVEAGDVLIARDQIGVKPLYIGQTAEGVIFASEMKALLECESLDRSLDFHAVHHYLTYLWAPAPETMLQSVQKLAPGEARVIRGGRTAYAWSFYNGPDVTKSSKSLAEIREELAEKIRSAVARQLVADVPVAAFLSGGVDSSAVVALMREVQRDSKPVCYCIGFGGGNTGDEEHDQDLAHAAIVAKHLDVELRPITVDASIIGHLERMLYLLDEPQADPAPINALLICQQAHSDGFKVMLSGAGGDDIFSGYRRHQALSAEAYWRWWPYAARKLISRAAVAGAQHGMVGRRTAKALQYAHLPQDERLSRYFWWSDEPLRRSLYSPELRDQLKGFDTDALFAQTLAFLPRNADSLDKILHLELRHFLADHNLNYTDRMGMAHGVEVRVPLLDLEVVQYAASIPSSMKQHGLSSKFIFKEAMRPYLPTTTLNRKKVGFGAPIRHWLRNDLKDYVAAELSSESLNRWGLFDAHAVRRLIDADMRGAVDASYTIFSLLCMQLWLRLFMTRSAPIAQSVPPAMVVA
jgi:asparagine synthase (glutamine-hydrolysing)